MKITKVEVFRLPTANSKQNSPIGCRIHTDVGICGDGETVKLAWPTALVVPARLAWSAIWQS